MSSHAVNAGESAREVRVRRLAPRDRAASLEYLCRDVRGNLALIDMVLRLGVPSRVGHERVELLGAWRASDLVGLGTLRPSIAFDSAVGGEELEAFLPYVLRLSSGLVKSDAKLVESLWVHLAAGGSRALVDRTECSCALAPADFTPAAPPVGARIRGATLGDLEELVYAARASLAEEGRPDPHDGDPQGFRRWVQGRLPRARVLEAGGRVCFVGYADVRCRHGWLLQGVYTWPERRRRGLARAGVSDLCEAAFREGASHVQLSVVDGNAPARRLYEDLGFRPFARLRTILFG